KNKMARLPFDEYNYALARLFAHSQWSATLQFCQTHELLSAIFPGTQSVSFIHLTEGKYLTLINELIALRKLNSPYAWIGFMLTFATIAQKDECSQVLSNYESSRGSKFSKEVRGFVLEQMSQFKSQISN